MSQVLRPHRALSPCPPSPVARAGGNWDATVAAYGYYDQSHLAKDVLAMTGATPREYREYLARKHGSPPPNHVQFLQDLPTDGPVQ